MIIRIPFGECTMFPGEFLYLDTNQEGLLSRVCGLGRKSKACEGSKFQSHNVLIIKNKLSSVCFEEL